ncbi:MAG: hypothetical protein HFE35_07235 [Clostridia bacterium]|jgi:hypothetical protein|nr:hypothetical protein [Clostridia bacterium]
MANRLDVDYEFEDNDASSAAFGWDFQVNAGVYLFLHYIKQADSVIVESKYQDIEINFSDKVLYAQAKALQDENTTGTENRKLRDALVSLSKVSKNSDDDIVYISNLGAPINGERDLFRNNIVPFTKCPQNIQLHIKQQVEKIINKLQTKLKEPNVKDKKKLESLVFRLENFDYEKFWIASIYPFGVGDDRDIKIKEKAIEVLTKDMGLDGLCAVAYVQRILEHWQKVLQLDSTLPDRGTQRKYINKKDFVWTVIALLGEDITNQIVESSLSSSIDSSLEEECRRYLSNVKNLYHERFEFMNKVIQDYEKFKHTVPAGQKADEAFIKSDYWQTVCSEFDDIEQPLLKEYVTKCYVYKMINRNSTFLRIKKGVNICE